VFGVPVIELFVLRRAAIIGGAIDVEVNIQILQHRLRAYLETLGLTLLGSVGIVSTRSIG